MKSQSTYSWLSPLWWLYRCCITLVFRSRDQHTKQVNGKAVVFDTRSTEAKIWFFPRYLGHRIHEAPATLQLLQLLDGKQVFFDVGANLGWHTCVAGAHNPKMSIVSFEMAPKNVDQLKLNVRLNDLQNVEIHRAAIADRSGEASYSNKKFQPGSLHTILPSPKGREATVKAISLDDFCRQHSLIPDVVKIDVEGGEMLVLKGMKQLLTNHTPRLLVEIHPRALRQSGSSITALLEVFFEAGYQVFELPNFRSGTAVSLRPILHAKAFTNNTMLLARKLKMPGKKEL